MRKNIKFENFFELDNLEMINTKCSLLLNQLARYDHYKKNKSLYAEEVKAPSEKYYSKIFTKHFPSHMDVLENWHTLPDKKKDHFKFISREMKKIYEMAFQKKPPFILNAFWK